MDVGSMVLAFGAWKDPLSLVIGMTGEYKGSGWVGRAIEVVHRREATGDRGGSCSGAKARGLLAG